MAKKHKKHKSGHTRGYDEEQELRDVGGKKMRVVFRMASPPPSPDSLIVSYSLEDIARARQLLSQLPGTSQKQKKHKKKKKHGHGHKQEDLNMQTPQASHVVESDYSFVPSYSLPTSALFDEEDKIEEEEEEEEIQIEEDEEVEEEEEVSLPVEIDLQRLSLSSQESQQHGHRRRSDKKKKKKKHKHKHHHSEPETVEEQQLPPQALMEEEEQIDTYQKERGGKSATISVDGGGWQPVSGGGKSMRCSDDSFIDIHETERALADQSSPSPVSNASRKPIPSPSLSSQSAPSPASSVIRHTMRLPKGALKYFLKHIHSQILRRDPDGVFSEPVTDDIAPGYTSIIKQPMDLQTMSGKIEGNEYPSVKEFKEDFVLMCNNAMTYNSPETLYYHTAKNLLSVGLKIIAKELSMRPDIRLGVVTTSYSPQPSPAVTESHTSLSSSTVVPLDYSSPFLCRIDLRLLSQTSHKDSPLGARPSPLGADDIVKIDVSGIEEDEVVDQSHLTKVHVGFEEEEVVMEEEKEEEEPACSVENMEEEILAQAEEVGDNLREDIERTNQSLASLTFVNKMSDGGTMMSILNPDTAFDRPVDLTVLSEKVKAGHSAATVLSSELPLFRATPVNYLMYGPFGSFAPTFDSSFATLTKQDSDLLLSTYGSDLGVSYANSLQQFVKGSGSFVSEMADAILNGLTGGRHGNFMESVRKEEKLKSEQEKMSEGKSNKMEGKESVNVSESVDHFKTGDVEQKVNDEVLPQKESSEGVASLENEKKQEMIQSSTKDESNEECVEIPENQSDGNEDTLARTSQLLLTLEEQQNERLSQPPSRTQDDHYVLSRPTRKELETVSQLTAGLADLTSQVAPSDLVSVPVLHKAMGIHMEEPNTPETPGDHHS